jgi:hypothetical protein
MSEAEDVTFFVAELCRAARAMPVADARRLLRGALALMDEATAIDPVRIAYRRLADADAQLELLAAAQLKLPLGEGNGAKGTA